MPVIDSVAHPGCLSRIPIFPHPGSNNNKKRGEKNLVSQKFKLILFLDRDRKILRI
jgi:hypothetical protein